MFPVYIIYDGQSVDGCGYPRFKEATYDKEVAKKAYKRISSNPYSTGHVVILNAKSEVWACDNTVW